MSRLQISIFHYHLLPGGVTDVIIGWANILLAHSTEIFPQYQKLALRICCGKLENVAPLQARLLSNYFHYVQSQNGWSIQGEQTAAPDSQELQQLPLNRPVTLSAKLSLEFTIDSQLGYQKPDTFLCNQLAEHLSSRYCAQGCDNLWWVHNYHLGKNAAYTQALLQIIRRAEHPTLWFLLHIHDFPECGRWALYRGLAQSQPSEDGTDSLVMPHLYPLSAKVAYASINWRDYGFLQQAGLPTERLFCLPNPIQPLLVAGRRASLGTMAEPRELRAALNQRLGLPDYALALYPVRCIRRKNVLELAVLNLLSAEPWNLICTLPGQSEAERPYSQLVEALFRDGVIQGRFGVGQERDAEGHRAPSVDLNTLCPASDLIVSSSVMEGFGFAYFQALYWGKPLLARYLDVLHGFEHCFNRQRARFYQQVKIPLRQPDGTPDAELAEMYCALQQHYQEHLAQNPFVPPGAAASPAWEGTLPPLGRESLPRLGGNTSPAWEGESLELPEYVDFGWLGVAEQRRLLLRLHGERLEELKPAPPPQAMGDFVSSQRGRVAEAWLLQSVRRANSALLADLQQLISAAPEPSPSPASANSRAPLAEFSPESLAKSLKGLCDTLLTGTAADSPEGPHTRDGMASIPESTHEREEHIGRKMLEVFQQTQYNPALLWKDDWPTQS